MPDILILDDDIRRLRWASKLKKKTEIKTAVYVQILFGIHAIGDVFSNDYLTFKEKLLYTIPKIIPFDIVKRPYKKYLGEQDIIIANSNITATLLHILYGIEPHGIVYPPVDTDIFTPKTEEKKNQVLLYLGSNAGGDTDEDVVTRVCEILRENNIEILVMGNRVLKERLQKKYRVTPPVSGVSDEKLAEIYSSCKLTICPQKWEMFGYVIAESIACGTPVLAFNVMGPPQEIVLNGKTGWLTQNKEEFITFLNSILNDGDIKLDYKLIRDHSKQFSSRESTKRLLNIISNRIGDKLWENIL